VLQDDDGFIMYESRAICRYLEDKYPEQGTKLVPSDVQGKALFEQAASIEYSNFDPLAYAAVAEMVFKPCVNERDTLMFIFIYFIDLGFF
jgi:glutathione S-transferase